MQGVRIKYQGGQYIYIYLLMVATFGMVFVKPVFGIRGL